MVEVFKTNVHEVSIAEKLIALLGMHFPGTKINFDMHDCDKILRLEGENVKPEHVISIVIEHGFNCNILD